MPSVSAGAGGGPPDGSKLPPDKVPPDPGRSDMDGLINVDNDRTLLVQGTDSQIASVNSFLIKKFLDGNIGAPKEVKKLRSGDLLIITNSTKQSRFLLKCNDF